MVLSVPWTPIRVKEMFVIQLFFSKVQPEPDGYHYFFISASQQDMFFFYVSQTSAALSVA